WLLIKKRDGYSNERDVAEEHPRSVLSGLTLEELRDSHTLGERIAREIERLGAPQLAHPMTPERFPLALAKLTEKPFDGDKWLFEVKYDGVRALAIRDGGSVRLFSRNRVDITDTYPEIALSLNALPFERFVIDGEIFAANEQGRADFQLLQRRMHVRGAAAAKHLSRAIPVCCFAFDLLAFGGFDLRGLALEARKRILAQVVRGEGSVRYCDHTLVHGRAFYDAVAESNLEGIIAKRRDAPYRAGRGGDWLKIKCPQRRHFVIGGYTDPRGSRSHLGALLLGLWDKQDRLHYVGKVGTGFNDETLTRLNRELTPRAIDESPFVRSHVTDSQLGRDSHFCRPELVCEVQFAEVTDDSCIRHPSFIRLVPDADPAECKWAPPFPTLDDDESSAQIEAQDTADPPTARDPEPTVNITNPDKVFWPGDGYTKGDLIAYYRAIAPWMLPYLKDRPVMITRYPDGIEGKSFYQKDAPGFAPDWIRREKIYSEESSREIGYFVLESADALAYIANMGTIPIHIWSSRIGSLERPDWLLFDIDPKGSTTANAAKVARAVMELLHDVGLRSVIKTSGQAGLHVMVALRPAYTYAQARDFSQLVAQLVVKSMPEIATIERVVAARKNRVYIDYLQLGHGKTIAAPFSVRPLPKAPVSAPLLVKELSPRIEVEKYNIGSMPARMKRLGRDPFIGAIADKQSLEDALPELERKLREAELLK
ncbi:MAG TPA: DNA ligase D, partial [Candidatus Acidoferrales bacterium]|nr:DNA ligase D [Candidatus Acidoferrales bacterium]